MKRTVTQRLTCGLQIPDGKLITIDQFTFLPAFTGERQAKYIQTTVEAKTELEAQSIANNAFCDFLAKLTLLNDSKYFLHEEVSVSSQTSGSRTTSVSFSIDGLIEESGNLIKDRYEVDVKNRRLRKLPLKFYHHGINSQNWFEKYRSFYKILEYYFGETYNINSWILSQVENTPIRTVNKPNPHAVTIYTWLRHKLYHLSRDVYDLMPLEESNSQHVALVIKYAPKLQELAREAIKLGERI